MKINCDGVRKDADGTIWLTKSNPSLEAYLDRNMLRVRHGERRWIEIPENQKAIRPITTYQGLHEDQIGLMLGKGPSLSRFLEQAPRQRWHVVPIGINEAAALFPCKYFFALDNGPLDFLQAQKLDAIACLQPRSIERPFKKIVAWEWTKHATPGHETAPIALRVASVVFGIKTFVMVGFDGYDDGRDDYAPELKLPARGKREEGYHVVNKHIDEVAQEQNLRLVWWHREGASRLEGQERLTKRVT